jgi:hypothetical protein
MLARSLVPAAPSSVGVPDRADAGTGPAKPRAPGYIKLRRQVISCMHSRVKAAREAPSRAFSHSPSRRFRRCTIGTALRQRRWKSTASPVCGTPLPPRTGGRRQPRAGAAAARAGGSQAHHQPLRLPFISQRGVLALAATVPTSPSPSALTPPRLALPCRKSAPSTPITRARRQP